MKEKCKVWKDRALYYAHVDTLTMVLIKSVCTSKQESSTHAHTLTGPRPSPTPARFGLPLRGLAQLECPEWHKPQKGQESATECSSYDSPGPSSGEAEDVGEDMNWSHFYRIGLLVVYIMVKQWLITGPCLFASGSLISCWADERT